MDGTASLESPIQKKGGSASNDEENPVSIRESTSSFLGAKGDNDGCRSPTVLSQSSTRSNNNNVFGSSPNNSDGRSSSIRQRYKRMSSIMTSSYDLIDSLQQQRQPPQTTQQQQPHRSSAEAEQWATRTTSRSFMGLGTAEQQGIRLGGGGAPQTTEVDPFISSLAKSMEILKNKDHKSDDDNTEKDKQQQEKKSYIPMCSMTLVYTLVQLAAFSILGTCLRAFLGRFFGSVCDNPSSTSWLHPFVVNVNLCVTSNGVSDDGGALFVDLPANMIGSFVMGLLQPSKELGLLNNIPIAFLNSKHWFQSWTIVHLGLRTGFCGALTTLASWNTQMVVMMSTSGQQQEIISAVFGYIIGLQTSIISFFIGKAVATWLYRWCNPNLAREEDMLMFAYSNNTIEADTTNTDEYMKNKIKTKTGRALPDYERRYLTSLLPHAQRQWATRNISALENLERWKMSTDEYRMIDSTTNNQGNNTVIALHEIEKRILVDDEPLTDELLAIAKKHEWDTESLIRFAREANSAFGNDSSSDDGTTLVEFSGGDAAATASSRTKKPKKQMSHINQLLWVSVPVAASIVLTIVFGIYGWDSSVPDASHYRTMFFYAVFAPFGTIVRWKLSRLNGTLKPDWRWFPVGTFLANIVASTISATTKGFLDSSLLSSGSSGILLGRIVLAAIQTGFAGSMSTVSTFVAEASMLQKTYPHHAKVYYYVIGTMAATCLVGVVIYAPLSRA